MRLRLYLAYDGAPYFGWQETPTGPSVQGVLRTTAEQILQTPVVIEGASRTDRGVHACEQQVLLIAERASMSPERCLWGIKRMLPPSMHLLRGDLAPEGWHPSLSHAGKCYRYLVRTQPCPLQRSSCWILPSQGWEAAPFDPSLVEAAATELIGVHDFSAFATAHREHPIRNPICHLYAIQLEQLEANLWAFWLLGDRFLYRMCRNLVGTLVEVARGLRDPRSCARALATGRRSEVGVSAPAQGLSLARIFATPEERKAWCAARNLSTGWLQAQENADGEQSKKSTLLVR